MKKSYLITNVGPALITHDWVGNSFRYRSSVFLKVALAIFLLGTLLWIGFESAHAEVATPDPMVMKVYPDGTKVIVRWSEIGKQIDHGEKFGGPPRIVAYDPSQDGIVPIGDSSTSRPVPETTGTLPRSSPSQGASNLPSPQENSLMPLPGFYIGFQPGGAVVENINFNRISASGTIGGSSVSGFLDATLVLDAGFRFDLPIGYRVNEWFSVEFAPAVIFNTMNSAQFNSSLTIGETTYTGGASANLDGNLIQVPLMVNFILTIPTDSPWEPFLGGGVGGVYSQANFNSISDNTGSMTLDQTADCWALGYSGLAGLNYHFDKNISIGFVYKFTGTGNQAFGGSTLGNLLDTGGTYTQSVSATATFRF